MKTVTTNCTTHTINASEKVTIDTPITHITGNLQVDQMMNASVSIGAPSISSPGSGDLTEENPLSPSGPRVSIVNGNLHAEVNITADVDVIGGGISLKNHVHDVIVTGGSSAGSYTSDTGK